MITAVLAQTRATSSIRMAKAVWPMPAPPYSSGIVMPSRPSWAARWMASSG